MAGEITIPILPCRGLGETLLFYEALGFSVVQRYARPNAYAVVRLEDIELHFFAMPRLNPAASCSTCFIRVPDPDGLEARFVQGLRRAFGKVPRSGIPRVTRCKDTSYGTRQFGAVDPAGNWLRIGKVLGAALEEDAGALGRERPLQRALRLATRLGESKGDLHAAAQLLDSALDKSLRASAQVLEPGSAELAAGEREAARDRAGALLYRAELALALGDESGAQRLVAALDALPGAPEELRAAAHALGEA